MENFNFESIKNFLNANDCTIEKYETEADKMIDRLDFLEYQEPKLFSVIKKEVVKYYAEANVTPSEYVLTILNKKLLKEVLNENTALNIEAKKLYKKEKSSFESCARSEGRNWQFAKFDIFCQNSLCKAEIRITKDELKIVSKYGDVQEKSKWVNKLSEKWLEHNAEQGRDNC